MRVELLSPVHIGTGGDISPYEYRFLRSENESERYHRLNFTLLCSEYFARDATSIEQLSTLEGVTNLVAKLPDEVVQRYTLYSATVPNPRPVGENLQIIREAIKTNNCAYLSGSSLKGALLTGYFFGKCKSWDEASKALAGSRNPEAKGLSRRLRIPDTPTFAKLGIYFPQRPTKDGTYLKQWVETLVVERLDQPPICHIQLPQREIHPSKSSAADIGLREADVRAIVHGCREMCKSVIKKELEYFRSRKPHALDTSFYEQIESMLSSLIERQLLLRIGWGSGQLSTSLILLQEKPKLPTTRWLQNDALPFGWCRITFEDSDISG